MRRMIFRAAAVLALAAFFVSAARVSAAGTDGEGRQGGGRAQGRKVVRIGYYEDSEDFQSGASGDERKTGYAYDYYQEIAKYTGWTYEYVYGSWNEVYDKLVRGEVDIMAGIAKTDSRMPQMLFPNYAMGEEAYYIYVPKGTDSSLYDAGMLDGARIGVKENSFMRQLLEDFIDEHALSCEIKEYGSLEERIEALGSHELDCIVTVENELVPGYRPAFKIGTSDFYFAVNKNRPDLLRELNQAQEEILFNFPSYMSRLRNKYFSQGAVWLKLTEKEAEWLAAHPVLRVGYLEEYMPYCDRGEEPWEILGILPELLAELEAYTGSGFESRSFDDYNVMLQALENGEIDVIFPTFEDLWYSENQNYTQTVAVAGSQMCVVYKDDYSEKIYDCIAVSEGSPLQPFYVTINYPSARQEEYRNWGDCLKAIQDGEVGSMLVNSNLIYRYLNEHGEFSDLHIAELEDMVHFCFAVRRSDITLYSILNKGLNNIDETRINDAVIRNSHVEPQYTLQYFIVKNIGLVSGLVLGFVLLLLLFFFLYWSRVKRERRISVEAYEKEKRYYADQEEKYNIIGSLSRIYIHTYYVDLVSSAYRRIDSFDPRGNDQPFVTVSADGVKELVEAEVRQQYREKLLEFLELATLAERMKSVDSISMEYETERGRWCRGRFVAVERDSRGRLLRVIYAIQIITEEKEAQLQAQAALENAYEAANRANHAKSDFLARMSHDIRTPMNAIIGLTAIAAAHLDERERVADCLKKITTSGKHLLTLINEVLDMSKIESGKLELTKEEFNLHELADNLLTIMQPQIEAKGQTLHVSIGNMEHEDVVGDILHIQKVLVNIMGNAVKYTPEGGRIRFSVAEKPTDRPKIGCYELVFEDNGIGMSKEFIKRIFEPFSREDETKGNQVQGTGLGLAIVASIVQMMDGEIKVESEQGKGSRFTVTLYLQLQEEKEISLEALAGLPVLVVDDRQEACESACLILKELGMKGEWVLSGTEAVERVRADDHYFAVILDWKMPGMDGVETARAIRETAGSSVPIIVLSGYDWAEIEAEAREAGVNTFISKPLSKRGLAYLFRNLANGESAEGKSPLEQIDSNAFAGKRLLLAEDNEINAEIAQEILGMAGLVVEWAKDGKEALDRLTGSEPGYYDMVFMDIQMPVMDGYEATRAIRSSGREDLKEIPIIAMTANAFAEDVRAAMQAGMNQHVPKPLDVGQLMAVMKKWLGE